MDISRFRNLQSRVPALLYLISMDYNANSSKTETEYSHTKVDIWKLI
jgi:hypothetical protein